MIIGVTGDTHNNLKNISKICTIFNENNVELVFHTGDISLPKSLLAFRDLNCPLKAVFGNNDIGEQEGLIDASNSFECEISTEPFSIEINKKRIKVFHHPELIDKEALAKSDLILHGHTHRYRLETIDKCIVFNPGECAGLMKDKNQVGIINLETIETKIINF